jgi:HEAT repeats
MVSTNYRLFYLAVGWLCCACLGCTDGPFFQMKKLNPYLQNQWKKDREKTVVFSQRVEEMRLLRSQIQGMEPAEQADWISKLDEIVEKETSPELRREAVLTLERVNQQPKAVEILSRLSKDKNDKVRLAVVSSLSNSRENVATGVLLAMASSDANTNVRLTATRALGKHDNPQVREFLGKQLDERNIAMRYQASQALEEMTGKRYGGDIDAWREYLAGNDVPEPKASIAESLESFFLRR